MQHSLFVSYDNTGVIRNVWLIYDVSEMQENIRVTDDNIGVLGNFAAISDNALVMTILNKFSRQNEH